MPSSAITTVRLVESRSCIAKNGMKAIGRCWLSKIGAVTRSSSFFKRVLSAAMPPVEEPIRMQRGVADGR